MSFVSTPIYDRTDEGNEYMTRFSTFKNAMPFINNKFKNGQMKLFEPFYGDGRSTKSFPLPTGK